MKYLAILIGLSITCSFAQQANNTWLFGTNAGLDFSTNPPTAITSPLVALEGTAVVSDNNGDLLFYTNGATIWDKNNNVMPNGNGVLGGASSTQPALIVPLANSCNKYYVFTTEDHQGAGTMRYTLVDLCLNGGLGDVVTSQKNILLSTNMAEKLTSVMHTNGSDIWILSHKLLSNQFVAFKLSPDGTIAPAVTSNTGYSYAWNNMIGPLKASQDGTKLAASTSFNGYSCELFNFNKSTGTVSYDRNLMNYGVAGGVYGLEFSPNNQLLYISTLWGTNRLYQFDLSNNNLLQLSSISGNYNHGGLQVGLNGKIYHARNLMNFLGVINNPNVVGVGCSYVDNGITLLPGTNCNAGFPVFNPYSMGVIEPVSNIIPADTVSICPGESYQIELQTDCNATVLWSTGSTSPDITFTAAGTYSVEITNPCNILLDTIVVQYTSGAVMELPADQNFCTIPAGGYLIQPILQGTLSGTESYLWNNGTSGSTLVINAPGEYWLEFTSSCGVITDTIVISSNVVPTIQVDPLVEVCQSNYPITLTPVISNSDSYSWSDGSSGDSLVVSAPGIYSITAINTCGTITESIEVVTLASPTIQLPVSIDTCISVGGTVTLTALSSGATDFEWSNSAITQNTNVNSSGTYWVNGSNSCGVASDTVQVTLNYLPDVTNQTSYTVCEDDYPLSINPVVTNATSVVWNDGIAVASRTIDQSGNYTIYTTNDCGIDSLTIQVSTVFLPSVSIPALIDTCIANGNTVPILAQTSNTQTTEWSTGNTTNQIQVTNSGIYWIAATNQCGTDSAFSAVTINYFPELYLPAVLDTCFEIGVGFQYTAQGSAGNYTWDSGSLSATEWISQEGIYTCTLTNQCGTITQSMEVNRMAAIDLFIPKDSFLLCYESIHQSMLGIETNYDYEIWDEQGHLIGDFIEETGSYTVHAYNICGVLDQTIYVDLQNEQYFYLPNAFTPDADEFNPIFIDKGYNYVIDQVEIFNRWGQLVYEESGGFSGWDGTYKGVLCQDGIYQVKIVYLNCAGKETVFYGHVVLLK